MRGKSYNNRDNDIQQEARIMFRGKLKKPYFIKPNRDSRILETGVGGPDLPSGVKLQEN